MYHRLLKIINIIVNSYSLMLKDSLKMLNVKRVEYVIICDKALSIVMLLVGLTTFLWYNIFCVCFF